MTAFRRATGRFYRYPQRGWVAGVCAGIADWLDVSVKWIRVIAILALIFSGIFPLVLVYAGLWYAMDEAPEGHAGRGRETDPYPPSPPAPRQGRAETADIETTFLRLERRLRDLEAGVTEPDFKLKREFRDLERRPAG
jgi:phage shock protein C